MSYLKSKNTNYSNSDLKIENAQEVEIKDQSRIVNFLTDLYENPVQAMTRELLSNALDVSDKVAVEISHGTEPYTFDLTIKDYGCGMSKEQVINNYVTYGNSSKRYNFSVVGSYGLGAKAPLAVVPQFTTQTCDGENLLEITMFRKNGKIQYSIEDLGKFHESFTRVEVCGIDLEKIDNCRQYLYCLLMLTNKTIEVTDNGVFFTSKKVDHYNFDTDGESFTLTKTIQKFPCSLIDFNYSDFRGKVNVLTSETSLNFLYPKELGKHCPANINTVSDFITEKSDYTSLTAVKKDVADVVFTPSREGISELKSFNKELFKKKQVGLSSSITKKEFNYFGYKFLKKLYYRQGANFELQFDFDINSLPEYKKALEYLKNYDSENKDYVYFYKTNYCYTDQGMRVKDNNHKIKNKKSMECLVKNLIQDGEFPIVYEVYPNLANKKGNVSIPSQYNLANTTLNGKQHLFRIFLTDDGKEFVDSLRLLASGEVKICEVDNAKQASKKVQTKRPSSNCPNDEWELRGRFVSYENGEQSVIYKGQTVASFKNYLIFTHNYAENNNVFYCHKFSKLVSKNFPNLKIVILAEEERRKTTTKKFINQGNLVDEAALNSILSYYKKIGVDLNFNKDEKISLFENYLDNLKIFNKIFGSKNFSNTKKGANWVSDVCVYNLAHKTMPFNDIKLNPEYVKREVERWYNGLSYECVTTIYGFGNYRQEENYEEVCDYRELFHFLKNENNIQNKKINSLIKDCEKVREDFVQGLIEKYC